MRRALAALTLVLSAAACAQTPEASAPDVKLYAMNCGEIRTTNADGFSDDGAYLNVAAEMIVPCYLIRHPSGDLIWDTGLPQALAALPNGMTFGPQTVRMPRTLTDQLTQLGLTPADIEFVSISHGHTDHAGNLGLFAQSAWIVDPDERAYMFRPEARADAQSFSGYAAMESVTPRLIEGNADFDVFGDGSVVIVQTPGHTPGHTVLLVRLAKAGPVLLTGDLWHLAASRATRRVPRFNTDRAQTLASMDKFEALARETHARVVIEHVPADFAALPAFPGYLD